MQVSPLHLRQGAVVSLAMQDGHWGPPRAIDDVGHGVSCFHLCELVSRW